MCDYVTPPSQAGRRKNPLHTSHTYHRLRTTKRQPRRRKLKGKGKSQAAIIINTDMIPEKKKKLGEPPTGKKG
jgi:hypothetical protein